MVPASGSTLYIIHFNRPIQHPSSRVMKSNAKRSPACPRSSSIGWLKLPLAHESFVLVVLEILPDDRLASVSRSAVWKVSRHCRTFSNRRRFVSSFIINTMNCVFWFISSNTHSSYTIWTICNCYWTFFKLSSPVSDEMRTRMRACPVVDLSSYSYDMVDVQSTEKVFHFLIK